MTDLSYKYYIIDGKAYDLKEWIPKHPGGHLWFFRSNGRDISAAFHTYHEYPKQLLKQIEKYLVDVPGDEALNPTLNAPSFILPKNFDAKTDSITFDFINNN